MIPDRIYEALPALYTCGGFLAAIVADNGLGTASGLLMAAVGVAVFRMRWIYRRTR